MAGEMVFERKQVSEVSRVSRVSRSRGSLPSPVVRLAWTQALALKLSWVNILGRNFRQCFSAIKPYCVSALIGNPRERE